MVAVSFEDAVVGHTRPTWRASGLRRPCVRRLERQVDHRAPRTPGADEVEVPFLIASAASPVVVHHEEATDTEISCRRARHARRLEREQEVEARLANREWLGEVLMDEPHIGRLAVTRAIGNHLGGARFIAEGLCRSVAAINVDDVTEVHRRGHMDGATRAEDGLDLRSQRHLALKQRRPLETRVDDFSRWRASVRFGCTRRVSQPA